jgi:class 3 adenylate cyclase
VATLLSHPLHNRELLNGHHQSGKRDAPSRAGSLSKGLAIMLGLNLGGRKRLLKAIAALDAGPAQDRTTEPSTASEVPREAERRQLTVMFVDMVGSTELAARLDPEDMREVIRCYQNAVAGEIGRFEGDVAKFMGDGVLTYFGWPRAHENEAERAVRSGLAITEALAGLATPAGASLAALPSCWSGNPVLRLQRRRRPRKQARRSRLDPTTHRFGMPGSSPGMTR